MTTFSLRVHYYNWIDPVRRSELLEMLRGYHGFVDEVTLFTQDTHAPLPLAELQRRAGLLQTVLPEFKALGLCVGINHLSTLGHLDENLPNSLNEPWQRLVDKSGSVSASCYCGTDPAVQEYIEESYAALAAAGPAFIWVDDDIRLESHAKAIAFACFCPLCLAAFSQETGEEWTREALLAAFRERPLAERLALRRRWLARNRRYVERVLRLARGAVDATAPEMELGFMTAEITYSGYTDSAWIEALAGEKRLPVKYRPGGGCYNDDRPLAILGKLHSVGRQCAFLPPSVSDIQYEHENFPYLMLNKSRAIFLSEITGAIAAGCNGAALNMIDIVGNPLDEYRPYFDAVRQARPFFDTVAAACGRSACEGVWPAFGMDHLAALAPDGDWPGPGAWGGDFHGLDEVFAHGVPAAYARAGATVTLLAGDSVLEWSAAELREMLAGGVLVDGSALGHLNECGLSELTGWEVAGHRDVDMLERFTDDPLNGPHAGWRRDCRPSFGVVATSLLQATDADARPLAVAQDFTPTDHGCCAGVFENRLGGRVAVLGYYPWTMLGSVMKTAQLRSVVRWLSHDQLPAIMESFHRIALWCRRDAEGRPVIVLLNASIDPAENVTLLARGCSSAMEAMLITGERHSLIAEPVAPRLYHRLRLPTMPPWSSLLIKADNTSGDPARPGFIRDLDQLL